MNRSTIAAISTPYGSGGIGIVRISGDACMQIAQKLFRRSSASSAGGRRVCRGSLESHRMVHGYMIDPVSNDIIDEVLLVLMKGPRSYTREDVVEIHSHAGYVVLRKIFENVIEAGASIAEPGEFTKRAFLNGRIDLTQAEAVIDIINAKTGAALRMAAQQMEGRLKTHLESLRHALQSILVDIEVAIDFPEEGGALPEQPAVMERIVQEVLPEIEKLLESYREGRHFRDGLRMAVVGRPNVGKSSLLNRLTEKERAIVTPIPGTTRDVIEEAINIEGLPVVVVDTAGLQDTEEEIERQGIQKTVENIDQADLILFVIDHSVPLGEQDSRIYAQIRHKPHVVVQNKIDLAPEGFRQVVPPEWASSPVVGISALRGVRIDELKRMIQHTVVGDQGVLRELGAVPNSRHMVKIQNVHRNLMNAVGALEEGAPSEIVAIDVREALENLSDVLGYQCSPDLLDEVFSRFCIGK